MSIVATRRVGGGISQQSQSHSQSQRQAREPIFSICISLSLHFLVCLFQILFFFRDLQVTRRGRGRGRGEVGRGKLVLLIDRDFCGKRGIETT